MEFYEFGSDLVKRAGVHDSTDIDLFTSIVSGLAHQQVANDPGGTRWVHPTDRAVEMFLADVQRRAKTGDPPRTRRKTPLV